MAFLKPKVEKLAFYFIFMKGLKYKNEMQTFLFWVPKMLPKKTAENIFLTDINLWTTMKFGFQDRLFMKKRRKILQGVLFS